MIFISRSRERRKLILRNYFSLTVFTERFIVDAWHRRCLNKPWALNMPEVLNIPGFWTCQGSGYTVALNTARIKQLWALNMPEFSIHRGPEYTRVPNMFLVLNMSGFWTYHCSEYARITQGFEYAWSCLNVPKSVWMAFVLHLPIVIPYLKES